MRYERTGTEVLIDDCVAMGGFVAICRAQEPIRELQGYPRLDLGLCRLELPL